jgi:hypothetical protein
VRAGIKTRCLRECLASKLNIFAKNLVLSHSSEIFRLSPGLTNRQFSGAAALGRKLESVSLRGYSVAVAAIEGGEFRAGQERLGLVEADELTESFL